jgi:hypothetical protein
MPCVTKRRIQQNRRACALLRQFAARNRRSFMLGKSQHGLHRIPPCASFITRPLEACAHGLGRARPCVLSSHLLMSDLDSDARNRIVPISMR